MLLKLLVTLFLVGQSEGTSRPIIGILSQETSSYMNKLFPGHDSYIAASYVKAVESSGARVVPILVGQPQQYYKHIVSSVNGVLLPGGSSWFYDQGGYADAGGYLMEEIKALNSTNFPVLGVCLGFELMLFLEVGRQELRADCNISNVALPLDLKEDFRDSRLFKEADKQFIDIISSKPVTMNFHRYCITEKNMTKLNLTPNWKVLSTNRDDMFNLTFVSSVESNVYPFVGLQFHPEKYYEWRSDLNNPHSDDGVLVGRYFYDWLVNESKKNEHRFEKVEEERDNLISNYPSVYTENRMIYDEVYLFGASGAPSTSGYIHIIIISQVVIAFMSQ